MLIIYYINSIIFPTVEGIVNIALLILIDQLLQ